MMTKTTSSVASDLELFDVKPGLKFPRKLIQSMLPDAKSVLFFGKVYDLNYQQLSNMMRLCIKSDVADALLNEGHAHSVDLQDYVVDICDQMPNVTAGDITFSPDVPVGEILPAVWESLEVTVAKSIQDVAAKIGSTIAKLPGKQGRMMFQSMQVMNAKRPVIGDFRAHVGHARQAPNLLILDDSGSMSESTVTTILDDVVAMAYMADAHFALVSNTTRHWEPGNYDSATVLTQTQFGGTHYETLAPLLCREWGTVITVADYDSSLSAAGVIAAQATGHINELVDVSLVDQPTYLAQVVGQLADKVTPVLVGQSRYVIS